MLDTLEKMSRSAGWVMDESNRNSRVENRDKRSVSHRFFFDWILDLISHPEHPHNETRYLRAAESDLRSNDPKIIKIHGLIDSRRKRISDVFCSGMRRDLFTVLNRGGSVWNLNRN